MLEPIEYRKGSTGREQRVSCLWCGRSFFRRCAEIRRWERKGRYYSFCNDSCSALLNNALRDSTIPEKTVKCPECHKTFVTRKGRFCSRSCASKGSVTQYRRRRAREVGKTNAQRFFAPPDTKAKGLRTREMWKYATLANFLTSRTERFEFEFSLDKYVFDLALPDRKLLIEFDGQYHNGTAQQLRDAMKTEAAEQSGWKVKRVRVKSGVPIPTDSVINLLV